MSSVIISLILLSILVIAHEYGHCIVAKKSGILVEEFAVGMGPKIFSTQKGETEYSIRLFPLGGFCRMQGESESGEVGPRSFFSKSVGVRFLVMAAGPFMNFVLAFVMLFGLSATSYMAVPEVASVVEGSAADEAGLQVGDTITRVDGKKIYLYSSIRASVVDNVPQEMEIEVLRDGEKKMISLTPAYDAQNERYMIGISAQVLHGMFAEAVEGTEKAGILETVQYSFYSMVNYIVMTAEGLGRLFTFTADSDEYGGPIAIVQMVGSGYESGLTYSFGQAIKNVVSIGAILSANLGVLNLFPIPALDGGRILFLGIEAIRRKPLTPELESKIQGIGFLFLMGLMLFVLYGDVVKLFA